MLVAVSSGDAPTARLAFQLLRDGPDAPPHDLLFRGQRSWDPIVRLRAAQLVRERLTGEELRTQVHRILSDRSMPIRREALYAFHEKLPDEAEQHLRAALFDRHAAVRDTARFLLRQRGQPPSPSVYRDALPTPPAPRLAIVIAALGETGHRSDIPLLTPFLDHPHPPVRAAAVRACARLDGDPLVERFLRLLRDDRSSKVSRSARDALHPRRHLFGPDRIWSIVEGSARPHARYHALTLLTDRDWWTTIEFLLRTVTLDDKPLRAHALALIGRRRHERARFTRRPDDAQLQRITAALAAAEPHLDPAFLADVRTGLDYVQRNFLRPR